MIELVNDSLAWSYLFENIIVYCGAVFLITRVFGRKMKMAPLAAIAMIWSRSYSLFIPMELSVRYESEILVAGLVLLVVTCAILTFCIEDAWYKAVWMGLLGMDFASKIWALISSLVMFICNEDHVRYQYGSIFGLMAYALFCYGLGVIRSRSHEKQMKLSTIVFMALFFNMAFFYVKDYVSRGTVLVLGFMSSHRFNVALGEIVILLSLVLALFLWESISSGRYYKQTAKDHAGLLAARTKYYEEMERSNQALRSLRHDFKNHLAVLNILLEKGDLAEAGSYVKQIGAFVEALGPAVRTGNTIADAILSDKAALAKEKGTTLTVAGVWAPDFMDSIDVCAILGNLLDNAMEAASGKKKNGDPLSCTDISLSFVKTDRFFMISETNRSVHKLVRSGDTVFSSKRKWNTEGFGLNGIRSAVEKYDGNMNLQMVPAPDYDEEYIFTLDLMIPLPTEETP